MEALYPITMEAFDALHAHVAVLNEAGVVIGVNNRWRRFGRRNGATSDYVGFDYLASCATAADEGDRTAIRAERRMDRLLKGELNAFVLVYPCAERVFRLRAANLIRKPLRILVVHEDITSLLEARRELHHANVNLIQERNQHTDRIGEVYEELGQRLAAIGMAAHAIERGGSTSDALDTIRVALSEARRELRVLRDEA